MARGHTSRKSAEHNQSNTCLSVLVRIQGPAPPLAARARATAPPGWTFGGSFPAESSSSGVRTRAASASSEPKPQLRSFFRLGCAPTPTLSDSIERRRSHRLSGCAPARCMRGARDLGRSGEIWGDMGRYGEIRGDMGRYGGDMGRYGEIWGAPARRMRGARPPPTHARAPTRPSRSRRRRRGGRHTVAAATPSRGARPQPPKPPASRPSVSTRPARGFPRRSAEGSKNVLVGRSGHCTLHGLPAALSPRWQSA